MTVTEQIRHGNLVTKAIIDDHRKPEDVAKELGVHPTRIYQILKATTGREQITRFLAENRDRGLTSREIAQTLRMDINKVQYVVDTLIKRGRASADRKTMGAASGDHKMLVDIKLTNVGLREAEKLTKSWTEERATRVIHPFVEERIPEQLTERMLGGLSPEPEVPAEPVVPEIPEVSVAEPLPEAPAELALEEIPHFPLINQLTRRNEKLQAAAKLIESAGPYDDLALTILSKLDDFTPLEKEILEYVRKHGEVE